MNFLDQNEADKTDSSGVLGLQHCVRNVLAGFEYSQQKCLREGKILTFLLIQANERPEMLARRTTHYETPK